MTSRIIHCVVLVATLVATLALGAQADDHDGMGEGPPVCGACSTESSGSQAHALGIMLVLCWHAA